MSRTEEATEVLLAIADLLDLRGEKFKPEAYRRAARSILGAGIDLEQAAREGGLGEIPGVGEAIQSKLEEFLGTGHLEYLERLRAETPPGLLELIKIPGLGPKTTARLHAEVGIDGPDELLAAIDGGRLKGVAGFGERKIEKLRAAVAGRTTSTLARRPLRAAAHIARGVVEALRAGASLDQLAVAGSLRRCREDVGDLDILATSSDPKAAIAVFAALPDVEEVVMQGPTKCTAIFRPGIQIDLRVVAPESFGAALQYFTGSKDHNVRVRAHARDLGLRVNEYAVLRGDERIAGSTEEEVYRALGLSWTPPEIRENQGEFEAALGKKVPKLLELENLQGELHQHLGAVPAVGPFEAVLAGSIERGWRFVGVVPPPEVRSTWADWARDSREIWRSLARSSEVRLLVGVEIPVPFGPNELPPPTGAEFVLWDGSSAGDPKPPRERRHSSERRVEALVHLRNGRAEVGTAWVEWAAASGACLEVTPDGPADGVDSATIRRAIGRGVPLVVGAGSSAPGSFEDLPLSVGLARRGWATPGSVWNTRSFR